MAGGKQKGKIAPYLVYANEVREDVKRALVDAGAVKPTMGEIAKAVGVRWKTLSDAQKATYKEKADAINAETAATRAADAEGGEKVSDRQRAIDRREPVPRSFVSFERDDAQLCADRIDAMSRSFLRPRSRRPPRAPRPRPPSSPQQPNHHPSRAALLVLDRSQAGEDGDDEDGEEEIVTLPLARVKRIMKCDKEVKTAAVDAAKVVSKATELFLESLTEGAFLGMKAGKRKTVKYDDLEGFVTRKPRLEFLHDHVWAFKPAEKEPGSGAFCDRAGPRTTAFARCTPFLEDFCPRAILSAQGPSLSIPTHRDVAFELRF